MTGDNVRKYSVAHTINGKEQLKQFLKLQKLHGTILRMMCPKQRSTPVASMEMMFYVSPLELVIKGEAIKAHMRNIHMLLHDWPSMNKKGQVGNLQANWDLCKQFRVPDMEWDQKAAKLRFDNNYIVKEDSYKKGLYVSCPGAITVYTDRSKVNEKATNDDEDDEEGENSNEEVETVEQVGCRFVVMRSDNEEQKEKIDYGCFHMQDYNSVYQAETMAMHRAVIHLLKTGRGKRRRRIFLLTDSKSLVQSLKRHQQDKKTVNNLIMLLNLLGAYDDIRVRWVMALAQCDGNNIATGEHTAAVLGG